MPLLVEAGVDCLVVNEVPAAIEGKALAVCFFAVLGDVRVRLGKGLRVAAARDLN